MLPKWFNDWNEKNPVDIYRPVIIFGTVGAVVIGVAAITQLGQPFTTDSLQTGPRGTGMSVAKYDSARTTPDPSIAGIAVTGAAAEDAGEVPEALASMSGDDYGALVTAMRQWTGIPDLMSDPESYQTQVAYRMIEMTQNINENWGDHVNAEVGVTCYTCHRGEAVPSDVWYKHVPNNAMAGWSGNQNMATPLSGSTSLPSDALEAYFLDYETIGVHDLESRAAGVPGTDGYPGIQHAERTFSLMNYFDNSLGVNCVFCHNTRAFYDSEQVTPQWSTASLGIGMVQELNEEYVLPLADVLPAERLGAAGDVPKLACKTCHKGYQQPMQGTNVIGDWPALATAAE